jgi:pilus assembly protein FimV
LGIASTDASAFALGQLKVQSALGEPLRAEIDVTEMSRQRGGWSEASTSPPPRRSRAPAFPTTRRSATCKATLQRRAGGQYVVRLSGNRPVNDPFIDLLLEANWRIGPHRARLHGAARSAGHAPGRRPRDTPRTRCAADLHARGRPSRRRARSPRRVAPRLRAAAPQPAAAPPRPGHGSPPARASGGSGEQVTVQRGDTASKIAGAHKPADVSLDQMLVALLLANPDAFVGGNVNRMRPARCSTCPAPPKRPPCRPRKRAAPSLRKAAISAPTANAWLKTRRPQT